MQHCTNPSVVFLDELLRDAGKQLAAERASNPREWWAPNAWLWALAYVINRRVDIAPESKEHFRTCAIRRHNELKRIKQRSRRKLQIATKKLIQGEPFA